jgi:hypothetical protein
VLTGTLLGLAGAWIGLTVQHCGNHGAMSTKTWVNKALGLCDDLIGGSSLMWRYHHQVSASHFVDVATELQAVLSCCCVSHVLHAPTKALEQASDSCIMMLSCKLCYCPASCTAHPSLALALKSTPSMLCAHTLQGAACSSCVEHLSSLFLVCSSL